MTLTMTLTMTMTMTLTQDTGLLHTGYIDIIQDTGYRYSASIERPAMV